MNQKQHHHLMDTLGEIMKSQRRLEDAVIAHMTGDIQVHTDVDRKLAELMAEARKPDSATRVEVPTEMVAEPGGFLTRIVRNLGLGRPRK